MKLFVVIPTGEHDMVEVECTSLSFDGGSLICFKDSQMQQVVAAFSPQGWLNCAWG